MATSSTSNSTDRLYADTEAAPGSFVFDERVAEVFGDMIRRSVPGYGTVLAMSGVLARNHARPGTVVYDLGCSLGAALAVMAVALPAGTCRLVGVDSSPAMIDKARRLLDEQGHQTVELHCADIRDFPLADASMVVLNFTLQFLPPEQRLELLRRIRKALVPGGVLVLSEKIAGADPEEERLLTELHHQFKAANGYSRLEIARKRTALEKVLVPETLATHRQRLEAAGFGRVDLWFRCFNFVSLLARP